MEFTYKMAFYVMFGISCFLILFLTANSVSIFLDPYGKKSEVLVLLLGASILGVGLYKAYHLIQISDNYIKCCNTLGIAWGIALVVILVLEGILFFSSPLK